MTNREAIETLKIKVQRLKDFQTDGKMAEVTKQSIETFELAIAALEKQEPQERIMPDEDDILDGIEYHCPNCGRAYKKDSRYDYCISCGQHLLWDEECVPMMTYNGGTNK